jgi:SPP1 gp7 family putative phage head morphogenesis protein
MTNPIRFGDADDRTGARRIAATALVDIRKRYRALTKRVIAAFEMIPVYRVNAPEDDYDRHAYGATPDAIGRALSEIQQALDDNLGAYGPSDGWFGVYVEQAMQTGAAQSVANLGALSATYAGERTLRDVLASAAHALRVEMARVKSYEHWRGLTAELRQELAGIIGRGIADGKNPRALVTEIKDRLGVSRSKASQYAQTDITDTLRQARWAEAEHARTAMGLRVALLWTSALKDTTRPWHAARHGRVYTSAQVKAFYGQRGNRFNCFCATTECLLDESGKPILSAQLKKAMRNELSAWGGKSPP